MRETLTTQPSGELFPDAYKGLGMGMSLVGVRGPTKASMRDWGMMRAEPGGSDNMGEASG